MSEPIDFASRTGTSGDAGRQDETAPANPAPQASNEVYARVGDLVLHSAVDGVRRGVQPEEIIREIIAKHNVRLTVGELRLLLATRRTPEAARRPAAENAPEIRD